VAHQWIFLNCNGFGFFREFPGAAMRLISAAKPLISGAKAMPECPTVLAQRPKVAKFPTTGDF
jgi:hypothetical protein